MFLFGGCRNKQNFSIRYTKQPPKREMFKYPSFLEPLIQKLFQKYSQGENISSYLIGCRESNLFLFVPKFNKIVCLQFTDPIHDIPAEISLSCGYFYWIGIGGGEGRLRNIKIYLASSHFCFI